MSTQTPDQPTRAHPLRRFIKATLWLTTLLCLLFFAAFFYLFGTSSGLRQLVSLSQQGLPGELQVQQVNGSIFDKLSFEDVRYIQPDMELSFSKLTLDWEPSALFTGKLHITRLIIEQPIITQIESAQPDSPSNSPALEDITLPFKLQIDLLQVNQLALNRPGKEDQPQSTTLVSRIQLQLHSDAQTLILDQLSIAAPEASIKMSGQLLPRGQYPIELNTEWSLTLPEKQPLSGKGSIKGALKGDLSLKHTLSGLFNTQLSASLQNLFKNPKGQLHLTDFNTELGQFSSNFSDSKLSGTAEAKGDLKQINFNSHWQTNLPEVGETHLTAKLHFANSVIHIDQLDLSLPSIKEVEAQQQASELKIQGDIDISESPISFNINGHWNNLHYPIIGESKYQSGEGKLQLKGDLQRYELSINSSVSGTSIPPGTWRLTGTGSDRELKEILLTGKTLEGTIQINGGVTWQPQLNWDLNVNGQQLNPGSYWSEWPGKLDFKAAINGDQSSEEPLKIQLLLESLSGILRDEPINAQSTVKINGSRIAIRKLQINVATTEIKASGSIDEKLDLTWALHSPDLNQLMPSLKGRLNATGSLTGTKLIPHLIATLEAENLEFNNNQSASLSANLDINLGTKNNSHIQLTASELSIAGQHWKKLTIDGKGTTDQHQLQLNTDKGPADLELSLSGNWKDSKWSGSLNQINLTQADLGTWSIEHPVPVLISSTKAHLETLCMKSAAKENSNLCLSGEWSSVGGLKGAINTQQLSLKLLQPWIPNQIELKGYIQSDTTFSQSANRPINIKGSAVIKGAELLFAEDDLHIIAEDIALNIDGQNNQLTANLSLPLRQPTGNMKARISIDDLSNTKNLDGDLSLALNDLKFVSLFSPDLQSVTGQINSKISVTGTAKQPIVQGHLILSEAATDLPALGIKLEGINFSVTGDPGASTLQFKGKMFSDKGPLELNGQYNPVTDIGEFSLEGDHFQAIATEEIQAWVSPDIKLNIDSKKITLRGELKIPEANIKPPDIQASSPISDDVVIVDPTAEPQSQPISKRTLDAQLRITLGDKIYLEALGFEGRLLGSILVEDDSRRATTATGIMQVATGQYRLYGQDLNIDRGSLIYSGGPVDNPGLDLRVSRTVNDVIAGAKVSGTLNEPRLKLFSDPVMPESSQLSYLMFGHAPGAGGNSMTERELLFKAASALTLKGGNTIAETITETLHVDELGVAGGETTNDASLYIGKYISPRLYVKYGVGLIEPTHTFFMRYKLNTSWSVETQTAAERNGGDIIYTFER